MIKNEKQYRISKNKLKKFEEALVLVKNSIQTNTHPILVKAQIDSINSQVEELKEEVKKYEELKAGIKTNIPVKNVKTSDLAYILFTSGSTGTPKGVPITFGNIESLVVAIDKDESFSLLSTDKCLQMFELTFDFSVVAYLFPLLSGACLYTIPKNVIKYFYIFKLIKNQKLTVLTMVPSIINYLRPYFGEINDDCVRYCSFGGGALHNEIAKDR